LLPFGDGGRILVDSTAELHQDGVQLHGGPGAMEQEEQLRAKLRVLQAACAENREAFLEALRRRDDVSSLIAVSRSLESAAGELLRTLRARLPASA
jgi:hypothetical protein